MTITAGADLLEAARALVPRIRELADTSEAERRLPPEIAEAFGRIGLWRMAVPASVGGLEVPLRTQLEVIETLSQADGSAGWCAMIGGTGGIVYSSLPEPTARDVFASDPELCTGGVFAPLGRVIEDDGGFRFSGRWPFGSGVGHSRRMVLGGVVFDDEAPRMDGELPVMRWGLFEPAQYEVLDTWYVSGLRGTGSHDVTATDVFVPHERTMLLGRSDHPGPMYRFPFFPFLAVSLAAVPLGIARTAIDELAALAKEKTAIGQRKRLADRSFVQMQVALAEAELRAARAFLYGAVDEAWERAGRGEEATLEQRAVLRLAATGAAMAAARCVDRMYEAGGGTSIYAKSRLQRAFRDVHAATQHVIVNQATLELAGGALLEAEMDYTRL